MLRDLPAELTKGKEDVYVVVQEQSAQAESDPAARRGC
jgi:hypothetical protein